MFSMLKWMSSGKDVVEQEWNPIISWKLERNGSNNKFAVPGGIDSNNIIFVARGRHLDGVIPGKLHVEHSCAYISHNGKEISKSEYEVLVAPPGALSWVETSTGSNIPKYAVRGGSDPGSGDPLFIGRVSHMGTVTCGKVHLNLCFIPYGGYEHRYESYEILVTNLLGRSMNQFRF